MALGLGEAGNYPAAIKTVAEWFPPKERSVATGIFNAGSNVGSIFAPLLVPWLFLTIGWKGAFISLGSAGFIWLIFWLIYYQSPEKSKRVTAAELVHTRPGTTLSSATKQGCNFLSQVGCCQSLGGLNKTEQVNLRLQRRLRSNFAISLSGFAYS